MKPRDRRALARYCRRIADRMALSDWTVAISHEPCDDDLAAVCEVPFGQKHITISFNRAFRKQSPKEQRNTVVHELIHAHHDTCWKMVQTDLAAQLGKPVYEVFCDSYRRSMEIAVDSLAKALAEHMPLIRWPA